MDAAVDVRLRSEVHDDVRTELAEDPGYAVDVRHVGDLEGEVLGALHLTQTQRVAGVGEFVEAEKRVLRVARDEHGEEVRSDEARSPGHENPHGSLRSS